MPRVPTYQRQIGETPQPGAQRSGVPVVQVDTPLIRHTPSAASKGAGFGDALAGVGQDVMQVVLKLKEDAHQAKLTSSKNELVKWALPNVYDPTEGALGVRGERAINLQAVTLERYDEAAEGIREKLSNDRLKRDFDALSQETRDQIQVRVGDHEVTETTRFFNQEDIGTIANQQALAKFNAGEPKIVDDALLTIRKSSTALAVRAGLGQEKREQMVAENISMAHRGIMEQMVTTNPQEAQTYLARFSGEMSAEDAGYAAKLLGPRLQLHRVQAVTKAVLAGVTAETKQSELELAIDELDPAIQDDVRKRGVSHLKTLQAEKEAGIKGASMQAKAVLDELEQDITAFLVNNPGKMPLDLVDAKTLGKLPREEIAGLNALAKSMMPGEKKIETVPAEYRRLRMLAAADPDAFLRENLGRSLGKLSASDWQEMVKLQAGVLQDKLEGSVKTQPALNGIMSDERMLQTSMVGIKVNTTTPAGKLYSDEVWTEWDAEVKGWLADPQNKGKAADDTQKQLLLDKVLMRRTVGLNDGIFWDTQKPAGQVTLDDVITAGDASILPLDLRRAVEAEMRKKGLTPNNATILEYVKANRPRKK